MTQSAPEVIFPTAHFTDRRLISFGSPQAGSRLLRLNQHANAPRSLPDDAERIDDLQMDHRKEQVN